MKNPYSTPNHADTSETRRSKTPPSKNKVKAKPINWAKIGRQATKTFFTALIFFGFWYGVYLLTKDFGNSGKIFSRNLQEFKSWDANPPQNNE